MKSTLNRLIQSILITLLIGLFWTAIVWESDDLHYSENKKTPEIPQQYALTTKVIDLDFENDLVTCEDCNGNLWQFFGVEDWEIEDGASLLMNDSGTPEIWDDVIESVKYNNWTLTK